MRIGIDLDRVVFDTEKFKEDRDRELGMHHVDADVFDDNNNYDQRKHARHCGVSDEKLDKFMQDLENYLDPSLHLLTELDHHELVLVTRGKEEFQRAKIEGSNADKYFDRVEIIEEGSKDRADIDVLIDDSEDEIEMVQNGIHYEKKEGLVQIFDELVEMKAKKVFKRYDIRGEFQKEIDQFFAKRLGLALSKISDKWVVGIDNKRSSKIIKEELINGLIIGGSEVVYVGEGPTDFVSYSSREEECPGIQITASHLKLDKTGFKLLYSNGNSFVNDSLDEVEKLFFETDQNLFTTPLNRHKHFRRNRNLIENWKQEIKTIVKSKGSEFDRMIVIDDLGGTGHIAKDILESLGFQVIENLRNNRADPPNPGEVDLSGFRKSVEDSGAYAGLVFDMDADRVRVYRNGWISGHQLIQIFSQISKPPYVVSDDTTQEFEGSNTLRTRVGDPFVLKEMCGVDAGFAGEPNGHFAFNELVPYNSGVLAGCIAVSIDLDSRLEETTDHVFLNESFEVEKKDEVMSILKPKISDETIVSEIDGITYREGSSYVMIRPSGTSPLVRVQIESKDKETAERALKKTKEKLRSTSLLK